MLVTSHSTPAVARFDAFLSAITTDRRSQERIVEWHEQEAQPGETLVESLVRHDLFLPHARRITQSCKIGQLACPSSRSLLTSRGLAWFAEHLSNQEWEGEEAETGRPYGDGRVPGLAFSNNMNWEPQPIATRLLRTVGAYRLYRVLGSGLSGIVYEAESVYGGERVALKLLRVEDPAGDALAARYLHGAEVVQRLNRPGCLPVLSAGRDFGYVYVVSPKMEAGSLADRTMGDRPSATEAVTHLAEVAEALAEVHSAGFAHGNIKAENILFGPYGPLLSDFALPREGTIAKSSAVRNLQIGDVAALVRIYSDLLAETPNAPDRCHAFVRRKYASAAELATSLRTLDTAVSSRMTQSLPLSRSSQDTLSDTEMTKEPAVGDLLGKCLLTGKLGQGATGVVYRATHQTLGIDVAVKVLSAVTQSASELTSIFSAEARILARLNHHNIVRIWDFEAGSAHPPYLILEFVDGLNLDDLIKQRGTISFTDAMNIFSQVVIALAAAHDQAGLIHRDIKPANILIGTTGVVKVADFGLASLVNTRNEYGSELAGTVVYMAPERFDHDQDDDFRADMYSLGVTLFEAVTGVRPLSGDNVMEIMIQHVEGEIPEAHRYREELPVQLSAVIRKMMAKKPNDRYQSYGDLLDALSGITEAAYLPDEHQQTQSGILRTSMLRRLFSR